MAGARKKPNHKTGRYQGYFVDWLGKRVFFMGTSSRKETVRMANDLEAQHEQVRLGYKPVPTATMKHRGRSYTETVREFIAWGRLQGRRDGAGWTQEHLDGKRKYLEKWRRTLDLEVLGDLDGILGKVEAALRAMADEGLSGNTIKTRVAALKSFCNWCRRHGYLEVNPLEHLGAIDTTPETERRALTAAEIGRLFAVAPRWRQLAYATAACSGLRLRELRALSVNDLDTENAQLRLRRKATKNRRGGYQPLPRKLAEELHAFVESGEAKQRYLKAGTRLLLPDSPLLFVPTHLLRLMDKDLKRAGIPKCTSAGRLDFHCWRVSFVTASLEAGASAKEAMELARHSTPTLTLTTYAKARDERLTEVVESIADRLLPQAVCAPRVHLAEGRDGANYDKPLSEQHLALGENKGGQSPPRTGPTQWELNSLTRHSPVPLQRSFTYHDA